MISKVRLPLYTIFIFILLTGCASSAQKNDNVKSFENLVTIQEPLDEPHQPSKVYIDSLKQIRNDGKPALLINGTFPDACTKLQQVIHHSTGDSLYIDIKAWRNPDQMCAQVLTPFSYIYHDLTEDELNTHSAAIINGSSYSF